MFFIFILQKFCLFVLIIRSIYICSTKFQIKKMIRNFLKSLNLLISLTDLKLLFIKPNTGIPSIFLAFHFNIKLYNHNIHIFFLTCRSLSHKNFFTCNIKPHTYWKFSVLAIPLAKHGLCDKIFKERCHIRFYACIFRIACRIGSTYIGFHRQKWTNVSTTKMQDIAQKACINGMWLLGST